MFIPTVTIPLSILTPLPADKVDESSIIEAASYPADEKASKESLEYRQREAPEYFLSAFDPETSALAGFVCGTRCSEFTEETMSKHTPDGPVLAIHSVCVESKYRRKRVATAILRKYVHQVSSSPTSSTITTIELIAKTHLLSFYVSCGFAVRGLSPIVHGNNPWFHLSLSLTEYRKPKFYVVDAFTPTPGCGNPAAVVLSPPNPTDEDMQTIAKEFNLSETVFVTPKTPATSTSAPVYTLAYFTPTCEINLCGHATLAAASVLFSVPEIPSSPHLDFVTRSGIKLRATNPTPKEVQLDFPENPPSEVTNEDLVGLVEDVVRSGLKISAESIVSVNCVGGEDDPEDVLVEVTPSAFSSISTVDLAALKATKAYHHGLIVCCEGDASNKYGSAFSSRFFAPKIGIDEDPVCGRAHTILCPYFSKKLGKSEIDGFQNSERGGIIKCKWSDGRVYMRGDRVIISSGKLEVPL